MITTIVFDIGNVLAHFGWREYLQGCGYDAELSHRVSAATVENPIWKEWDRGSREEEDLIEECCRQNPDIEKEIRALFDSALSLVEEYDYAPGLVKQLKDNGYKIYILSNYSKTIFEHDKEYFQFLQYVDGGIVSYQIKHVKPEPEIYEALIHKYGINTQEAVFIDDLPENLEGAKPFGFHTIWKQSYEQILIDLRAKGVNI
jgi:putative hydrolase of the HAD superfamily